MVPICFLQVFRRHFRAIGMQVFNKRHIALLTERCTQIAGRDVGECSNCPQGYLLIVVAFNILNGFLDIKGKTCIGKVMNLRFSLVHDSQDLVQDFAQDPSGKPV